MLTVDRPIRWVALLLALAAPIQAEAAPTVPDLVRAATSTPDLQALREASAALDRGAPELTLRHLEGYTGLLPDLAALLRARALAVTNRLDAAGRAIEHASPPPPRCPVPNDPRRAAPAELLASLWASKDPEKAAKFLLALDDDGPRLAEAAARMGAAGNVEGRRGAEARLLRRVPESYEARQLALRLGPAGVTALLGTREARMERVRTLLDTHQNEAAVDEAAALTSELPKGHALRCELSYIKGKSLRKLRRYRPAQAALRAARLGCMRAEQTDLALRSALLEARVRAIRGQVKGTKVLAEWIQSVAPGHAYADDALLLHAEVLARRGQDAAALAAYRRLVKTFPRADYAPTAAWRLALDAIRSNDPESARPHLDRILEAKVSRPAEHARARYWQATLALARGDEAEARRGFERLVLDPTFYGWLALDRLAASKPKWVAEWKARLEAVRSIPTSAPLASDLEGADLAVRRAAQWAALGATREAEAELAAVACTLKSGASRRALAAAYHAIGAYREAQMVMRATQARWRRGPVDAASIGDWRLAHSRPYGPEISAAAGAERVDPLFLTALSREESTFDPEIVSWAGATGLAQLMPATAVGAFANVYGGRFDPERLTEPALNLRLGAHVLGQGLRSFRNAEPLALAAYNGGPGLARRFVPDQAVPFDVWVETLTVKETRRYVKRVLETWGVYRWLYHPTDPFVGFPTAIGGSDWKR